MIFRELIISTYNSLTTNKMRTFLTMIGIIVSINAGIIIHIIGGSLSQTVENSMSGMRESNMVNVDIGPKKSNKNVVYNDLGEVVLPKEMRFNDSLLKEYENYFDGKVSTIYETPTKLGAINIDSEHYSKVEFEGVNEAVQDFCDAEILSGRFISDEDVEKKANTAVISDLTAEHCFGEKDPVGEYIFLKDEDGIQHQLVVVGIYQFEGQFYETDEQNMDLVESSLYVCYSYFQNQYPEFQNTNDWQKFYCNGITDFDEYKQLTKDFFERHFTEDGWEVKIVAMVDEISYAQDIIELLTKLITIIAVVSLITGGMGIMNIMLVSVNERTREIGVKKAIGATNGSVIGEIIFESAFMSLSAAVIGVVSGLITSFNIVNIAKIILNTQTKTGIEVLFVVPYGIIVFSLVFSVITGVAFGLVPAIKASKMDIVEALRTER